MSFLFLPKGVTATDIIAELVEVCTAPCPPNPFEVDFDYFEALPVRERTLATAAMISFMRRLLTTGVHHYDRRGNYSILVDNVTHYDALVFLCVVNMCNRAVN